MIPLLVARLKDPEAFVRASAAIALGRFWHAARGAVPALLEALADSAEIQPPYSTVATAAAQSIATISPETVDTMIDRLLSLLADPSNAIRRSAAGALRALGTTVSPRLFRALADPKRRRSIKTEIVGILAGIHEIAAPGTKDGVRPLPPEARDALPTLREMSKEGDYWTVTNATRLLAAIDGRDENVVRLFVQSPRRDSDSARHIESLKDALKPAMIPSLVAELFDPDPEVRAELLRALIDLSKNLPFVGKRSDLRPDEEEVLTEEEKAASAEGLRLRTLAARAILPLLKDSDPAVRWNAASALGAFQAEAKTVVPLLVQMVQTEAGRLESDQHVVVPDSVESNYYGIGSFYLGSNTQGGDPIRIAPIQALGAFEAEADTVVPELVKVLRDDKDPRVRWFTAGAIARLGPSARAAAPALVDALRSSQVATGGPVVYLMGGPPTIGDGPIRLAAAVAFGKIGPDARDAVAELTRALSDPDPRVRGEAAAALGAIGPDAAAAVNQLANLAAEERDDMVPELASGALAAIGEASVPALTRIVRGGIADARVRAIAAVGEVGPKAITAIPDLMRALVDPDENVRTAAAEALGRAARGTGAAAAVPGLINAFTDPDHRVREQAALALGTIGARTDRVIPALVGLLKDSDPQMASAASNALETVGMPAFPALRALLRDDNPDVTNHAVSALSGLATFDSDNRPRDETAANSRGRVQAARAALLEASRDPDEQIRTGAARALSLGDDNILPDLIADLRDGSPAVRLRAARSLGFMGSDAASALAPLRELLRDPDPAVRGAVAAAIKDIEKRNP